MKATSETLGHLGQFGEVAVELGYLRLLDLNRALELQRTLRLSGIGSPPIGIVLQEMRCLSRAQVQQILEHLEDERRRTGPSAWVTV